MGFVYFLGRFHVLVLHLPIGILTLAIVLEALALSKRFAFLKPALGPVWLAGALSAILTAVLGLMHASESGFEGLPAVGAHRTAGLLLTLAACVGTALRLRLTPIAAWPGWTQRLKLDRAYRFAQPAFAPGAILDRLSGKGWMAAAGATLVMLFLTGHLGGNLTHGDTYLVEYAPAPIRWAVGAPAETAPRPEPKDLASADIYLDVVSPALRGRCASCHNDSKKSGRLSVVRYDDLIKGGKHGEVITPGDAAKSDLFRRITLEPGHKEFMPKDGKTPLTKAEVAAIGWWIAQGAPKSAPIGKLKLTAQAGPALNEILGFGVGMADGEEAGAGEGENADLPAVPAAARPTLAALETAGFNVRPVAKGSNLLDIDYTLRRPLTAADFALLSKVGPQILRLNLRGAGVSDAGVKAIGGFANLRHLRLEANPITDAAAGDLARLKELRYLNLVGTGVTDAGLTTIGGLPKLQEVYVWQTAATDAGVARFRQAHAGVKIDVGLKPGDVPKETKILLPR